MEVAWRFKTDNLGNHPEYKLEGTPVEVNGVVYTTGGNRRDVVALDATTGELLWVHGEHEGARGGGRAAAALGPRSGLLAGRERRRRARHLRHAGLLPDGARRQDRAARQVVRRRRPGRHEGELQSGDRARSDDRRDRPALRPHRGRRRGAGRVGVPGRVHADELQEQQGAGAGLRRPHRPQDLGMGHHPEEGREGLRHLAERLGRCLRQHRRLDRDHGRPRRGPRLSGRGSADQRLLRRQTAGRQPVFGQPRRGRSEDRQDEVVLPARAPRHLGLRHVLAADADGHRRQRQADQGGGRADQDGHAVRVRSHDRQAGLADSGEAGAAGQRAGRMVFADPADSQQAAGLRAQRLHEGRPDRLHAGAAREGARNGQGLPARAGLYAAGAEQDPAGGAARDAVDRAGRGRHQLAGRVVQSRESHGVHSIPATAVWGPTP